MKTTEQIMEELKSMGIDSGSWAASNGGQSVLPSVERQRESMIRLSVALNKIISGDQSTLDQLREQLKRLEHGGGA